MVARSCNKEDVGSHNTFKSKEDQTRDISKSIFVTNFPDHFSARDLWNVCLTYGTVVDVFIPFKRSKAGKKFAFVRFIKVDNLDRLIGNLCTIWIGRLRLHANNSIAPTHTKVKEGVYRKTFANVLSHGPSADVSPAIVLDDSCLQERDFSCSLMGKIKDINALSNLFFALAKEGFTNVKLSYLGGHWVLIELDSVATKEKVVSHTGVGSWFEVLKQAYDAFVCEERLVWVTIEGLPVRALTRNSFAKIVSSWGELIEIDDAENCSLSCIRVCVKTKPHISIDDRIKIIIKGQIFWIRVKEWEAWIPDFENNFDEDSSSDEESAGDNANDAGLVDEELDHVSESKFDLAQDSSNHNSLHMCMKPYKYPSGYTPAVSYTNADNSVVNEGDKIDHSSFSPGDDLNQVSPKPGNKAASHIGKHHSGPKVQANDSILDVMDELIKVGLTMGYNMEGVMKNIETIIGSQGDGNVFR
ncbi:RNA-directed DNA polymerase, eukaryota, nucleotide-binding alpha-beta plait domain protein [Tanacetum coccineum]